MSRFIPNSFQVPNAVIDELMAELSGAELKLYLFVLRKTKGWNKEADAISVSQFMEACNLSNRKVIDACKRLVELGLLTQKTGARGIKVFSVKNYTCEESSLVNKVHSTCEESSLVTSEESSHTKNNIKNTPKNINNTLASIVNAHANEHDDLPVDNSTSDTSSSQKKSKKQTALEILNEFGIVGQLAKDFITHRKSIKATITQTAMNGFRREAMRAGIPIQRAVEIAIERCWRGFNADWDWRGTPNSRPSGREPINVHSMGWSKGLNVKFGDADYDFSRGE